MKSLAIADRKPEIEFFRQMLAGTTEARILLIRAASGRGKTGLLRRLDHECPEDACLIHLDFKGAELGLAQVFGEFRERLGVDQLAQFTATLARLAPSVNIANNTAVAGTMDISVVLNVDEQTRRFNLEQLEHAFFDDLRLVTLQIVVIFDTFEKAPPDLQNWLGSTFLRHVERLKRVCIVIGGQQVPEPTSERWEDVCERRELQDIQDVAAWHAYVVEKKLPHPPDAVKQTVLFCKGNPAAIDQMLQSTAPEWSK